jgi:polysaccharide biosynthesis PFTS motif protein
MFKIRQDTRIKKRENQIVIFDVSPLKHVTKTTFYQMDLITKFFEDIITVKHDLAKIKEFDIFLKPKRAIGISHLRSYRQMLTRFQNNADLEILDWNTNPYTLIAESVLTISIPFTSIALIGKEFDTKSIYYYPFPNRLYHPNLNPQVPTICEVINLRRFIQENFC